MFEKGGTNMKRKKTRMSYSVHHWKLKYQCELMVFNLNRNKNRLKGVCVFVRVRAPALTPALSIARPLE